MALPPPRMLSWTIDVYKHTLIDRKLADQLGLNGVPEQIRINTITNTDEVVASRPVPLTLSPAHGYMEDVKLVSILVGSNVTFLMYTCKGR